MSSPPTLASFFSTTTHRWRWRHEGERVLRLHFTAEDLARVRITPLGPLAETELALRNLQCRGQKALFGNWRAQTGSQIPVDGREVARFIASPLGGLVDLFTLIGPVASMDEGIERLRGASDRRLHEELSCTLGLVKRGAPWLGRVVDNDRRASERLAHALAQCHHVAVAPYWDCIDQHLCAEVALRGRLMARGGVAGLLESLRPMLVWKPPVLEIPGYRLLDHRFTNVHLSGRDFALVPSVFCGATPHLFAGPDVGEVLLVYPALREPIAAAAIWSSASCARQALASVPQFLTALLGRTRAIVLCTIADHPACTTTQLAVHAGISLASASEHASILRKAGLSALTRDRKVVLHTPTHAGLALVNTSMAT